MTRPSRPSLRVAFAAALLLITANCAPRTVADDPAIGCTITLTFRTNQTELTSEQRRQVSILAQRAIAQDIPLGYGLSDTTAATETLERARRRSFIDVLKRYDDRGLRVRASFSADATYSSDIIVSACP